MRLHIFVSWKQDKELMQPNLFAHQIGKKMKITPKLPLKNEWTNFFEGKSVTTP